MACFLAVILAALVAAPKESGAKPRALLIGINKYVEVPHLRGAINDIEMMREIAVTRFGFAPADIEVLTDERATRSEILAAFDRLAARTQPGDLVYVHYSGHGSQVPDQNGDEQDGMDETLISHDGRTPGVRDITDDELGTKLAALRSKTVVIVLDSCHAGTATRSLGALSDANALLGGMRPRYLPPDSRTELYASSDGAVGSRGVVPLVSSGHVLFTGAANNEEALDGPIDQRPHGLFSFALGTSLARSAPSASARQVFAGVAGEFERIRAQLNLRQMPDPQLEAEPADLDAPLFSASSPVAAATDTSSNNGARLAWLRVIPHDKGRVRLERGAALGAGLGSLWAVYPPGEQAFAPGAALAVARISALAGADSLATLEPKAVALPADARAVALSPPPSTDAIPVALVDPNPKRAESLRNALVKASSPVRFVEGGEFARFVVRCDGKTCLVTGADGLFEVARLDAVDPKRLAESLASLFARSATVAELLSLSNSASEIELQLAVVAKSEPIVGASEERGMKVVSSSDSPQFRVRREGQPRSRDNSLQLRIESSADCTLTVVDVDAQGGVVVLFPNAISEKKGYFPDGRLAAGKEFLLPDSLAPGNRAGFYIDYSPPAGTDTVRAFCTRDARAAKALRESIRVLDPNTPGTRGLKRERVSSLRQQLASLAARGLRIVEDVAEPVAPPAKPPVAPPIPPQQVAETESTATLAAAAWAADWAAASMTVEVRD